MWCKFGGKVTSSNSIYQVDHHGIRQFTFSDGALQYIRSLNDGGIPQETVSNSDGVIFLANGYGAIRAIELVEGEFNHLSRGFPEYWTVNTIDLLSDSLLFGTNSGTILVTDYVDGGSSFTRWCSTESLCVYSYFDEFDSSHNDKNLEGIDCVRQEETPAKACCQSFAYGADGFYYENIEYIIHPVI